MTPLLRVISMAVILSAGVTIVAHYLQPPRQRLIYVFKPLTTLLIFAAALMPGTFRTDPTARAIALGLIFSLAGDIWLIVPADRFVQGLAAFLLANLCYIFAFSRGTSAEGFVPALLVLLVIGASVLAYLWGGLPGRLKVAVSLYVAVIVLMAAFAVGHATGHFSMRALSAAIGAPLFLASDAMLAINRFRRPFHWAHAWVLGSYFGGQLLIALSTGLPN